MAQELRSGDVFVRIDDAATYAIGNAELELQLRRAASGELIASSLRLGTTNWAVPASAVFGLAPRSEAAATFLVTSVQMVEEVEGVLALRLSGRIDGTSLAGDIVWRAYPGTTVLTVQSSLRNEGAVPSVVEGPASLWLVLVPPAETRLATLRGGAYHDGLPPNAYTLDLVDLDGPVRSRSSVWTVGPDGRSSSAFVPWFALVGPAGGLVGALEWSGRWRSELAQRDGRAIVALGLSDFQHELKPGEQVLAPPAVLCAFSGDLDAAGAQLHAWQERYLCPPVPDDWPWVQYNHWYAYHADIDAERLLREAEFAAGVGCEVFVIDDGWFVGRRPDSYTEGWGNWVEDRTRFPQGLRAFGDRLRDRGLRFGLWVEPERVDANGTLAQEHPDWLAQRDGRLISRRWGQGTGAHLCLGVPAVQEWMVREIVRVVQEYGVDWLKWDYNMGYGLGCNRPDHGHQAGDGHYAYTLGLYRVLAEIRSACPRLMIENCASGGNRVDLGLLRYSHTQWLSDYTHRAASCRHHAQGAWYALPPYFLNTWVLEQRDPVELRSRMGGAFGISARLGDWSPTEREALARAIAEYKRLRPLLRRGRYVLGSLWHSGWDIWQFHDPVSDRSAVLAFREGSAIPALRVQLRGLKADRQYRYRDGDDGTAAEVAGRELLEEGLPIALPLRRSALIWIEPTSPSNQLRGGSLHAGGNHGCPPA